jgi:hypothetical protein
MSGKQRKNGYVLRDRVVTRIGWRRRLAGWLDPSAGETPQPSAGPADDPAGPEAHGATPTANQGAAGDAWPRICEQFAMRVLAAAYQMSSHLEAVEAGEHDPDRLEQLYRIDHANTRIRRQAENLQVLAGRRIEDADRQVTSLLDVVRAATSAVEHYPRVHIGRIAELAVVEFAADDVIRVLTELLDNAARFSPPTSSVLVSAHLTELGNVLLRVEDAGIGLPPQRLAALNEMFDAEHPARLDGSPESHLGLMVVQRLALTHRIWVRLNGRQPAGTTATVLIPQELVCEIPRQPIGTHEVSGMDPDPGPLPPPAPAPMLASVPTAATAALPTAGYRGRAPVWGLNPAQPDQPSSPGEERPYAGPERTVAGPERPAFGAEQRTAFGTEQRTPGAAFGTEQRTPGPEQRTTFGTEQRTPGAAFGTEQRTPGPEQRTTFGTEQRTPGTEQRGAGAERQATVTALPRRPRPSLRGNPGAGGSGPGGPGAGGPGAGGPGAGGPGAGGPGAGGPGAGSGAGTPGAGPGAAGPGAGGPGGAAAADDRPPLPVRQSHVDRMPWPDETADFAAGIIDARNAGGPGIEGTGR